MAVIKIGRDNIERFTVIARPRHTFVSSSSGATGSIRVFPRGSTILKEVIEVSSAYNDDDPVEQKLLDASNLLSGTASFGLLTEYLSGVNERSSSQRQQSIASFNRIEPAFFMRESDFLSTGSIALTASLEYMRKLNIQNVIYPAHHIDNNHANFGFTNYQCLNFFTSSTGPDNSAIIYDNTQGVYTPSSGAFTFEFHINPRYQNESPASEFKAGTIMHMSSTFAVSLVSGSLKDNNGLVSGYRLLLQLTSSAETSPSAVNPASLSQFSFLSDDNSLLHNNWHHVAIRWDYRRDNATGSFIIDGVERGKYFVSASSFVQTFTTNPKPQDVLFIGNFYEGQNTAGNPTSNFIVSNNSEPGAYQLRHPANAEIHEARLWNSYLEDGFLGTYSKTGFASGSFSRNLKFYLPIHFVKQSRVRQVFINESVSDSMTTDTPMNVSASHGAGIHEVNVENFVREFVNGQEPRLFRLRGNEASVDNDKWFRRRNLTILPCDNGNFIPNYRILTSGSLEVFPSTGSNHSRFVNDFGALDLSLVSVRNLFNSASYDDYAAAIISNAQDPDPSYHKVLDENSRSVIIFDPSNLFYGSRINPTTLMVRDSDMTGSFGRVGITLRDNGRGGLYRADALTPHATSSQVGTVFYDEGVAVIATPLLFPFGKKQFEAELRGERPIHVMQISAPCPAGQINSSSNPTFQALTASNLPNETSVGPVIITGINFHDNNMNVVMRTTLAQPIVKREEDRFLFKAKMDF